MLNRYSEFIIESLLLRLDESIVYYSDDFIETLTRMNTDLSKKLLSISSKDLDTDVNYIDITDTPDQLSFIPDARAESLVQKLSPPSDNNTDWKKVELIDPSRAYDYHLALFKYFNIDEEYLPAPIAHTMGWARLATLPGEGGPQKFWHFKADLDDPNYIESVKMGIESGEPDEMRKQDSFYAADEYSSAFKFIDPYKELTKVSKNRNPIKIGRLIKRLLQLANYNASDKEIEEFVNKYKSTYTTMKDKFRNFKIVSGEEIKHHYDFRNYGGNKKGTLGSSCMRHAKCQDYFKIYTENPEQVRLLVLIDPITNKTMGRALVWNATFNNNPITFMDRIYTIDDSAVQQFIEYAKENGWSHKQKQHSSELFTMVTPDGDVENPTLDVKLKEVSDDWEFPYVDTIKYLNVHSGEMSTSKDSVKSHHSDTYKLESQEGTNAYCDSCGGEGSFACEECDGRGSYTCSDCNGSGEVECNYCDGSGIDPDEKNDDESDKECEHCSGNGMVECGTCEGNGRERDAKIVMVMEVMNVQTVVKYIDEMINLEANNINESIFGKIKDFFKQKPYVRQATEKEKKDDNWEDDDDMYDDIYGNRSHSEIEKLKRWQKNPDAAIEETVQEISKDFRSAPYTDKINITTSQSDAKYIYTFENKDKITISLTKGQGNPILLLIHHKYGVTITIGISWHNAFIEFLNKITEKAYKRPSKQHNRYTGSTRQTETPKPKSTNPKKDTYDKLKATYKLRKEHLDKMKPNDPERTTAQNELNALANTIKSMKAKHQFEHLKSFENFNI